MSTQSDRIAALLAPGAWVSMEALYDTAGPSARTRMSEMYRDGTVEKRPVSRYDLDGRFRYVTHEWRLVEQTSLF